LVKITQETLYLGNEIIEIVQEYNYLGVYFTSNGLFTRSKAHIIEQANNVFRKNQLKIFKYVLNLKMSTPSYMIYGELGIFPIVLDMKYRTISYWIKLIENASSDNVKLSTKTYLMLYNLFNVNFVKSKWIENVKSILVEGGLQGVWYNQ